MVGLGQCCPCVSLSAWRHSTHLHAHTCTRPVPRWHTGTRPVTARPQDKLDIQLTLTIEEVEPGVSCRQVSSGACGWSRGCGCSPGVHAQPWLSGLCGFFPLRCLRSHARASSRPHQILEGNLRVKMFGVGRIVEGIVKDSLTNVSARGDPCWSALEQWSAAH